MENKQTNLNDVYEFTRGQVNAIINGLAKAPAEDVFELINQLFTKLESVPSKLAQVTTQVQTETTTQQ